MSDINKLAESPSSIEKQRAGGGSSFQKNSFHHFTPEEIRPKAVEKHSQQNNLQKKNLRLKRKIKEFPQKNQDLFSSEYSSKEENHFFKENTNFYEENFRKKRKSLKKNNYWKLKNCQRIQEIPIVDRHNQRQYCYGNHYSLKKPLMNRDYLR